MEWKVCSESGQLMLLIRSQRQSFILTIIGSDIRIARSTETIDPGPPRWPTAGGWGVLRSLCGSETKDRGANFT